MKKKIFIAFFFVIGLKAEKENFAFFTRNNKIHDHLEREVKDDLSIAFVSDFGLVDLANVSGTKDNSADHGFSGSEVKSVNDSSQNSNTVTQASNKSDEVYRDFNGSETSCSDRSKVVDHNNESSNNFRGLHGVSQPSNAQEANAMPSDSETASQQLERNCYSFIFISAINRLINEEKNIRDNILNPEFLKISKVTESIYKITNPLEAAIKYLIEEEEYARDWNLSKEIMLRSNVEQLLTSFESFYEITNTLEEVMKDDEETRIRNVEWNSICRRKVEITNPLDCLALEAEKRNEIEFIEDFWGRLDYEFRWRENFLKQQQQIQKEKKAEEVREKIYSEVERSFFDTINQMNLFVISSFEATIKNFMEVVIKEAFYSSFYELFLKYEQEARTILMEEELEARNNLKKPIIEQNLLETLKEIGEIGFASNAYKNFKFRELEVSSILSNLNYLIYIRELVWFEFNSCLNDMIVYLNDMIVYLNNSSFSDENKKQMHASFMSAIEKTITDNVILQKIKDNNKNDYSIYLIKQMENMSIFLFDNKQNISFAEFKAMLKQYLGFVNMRLEIYKDTIKQKKTELEESSKHSFSLDIKVFKDITERLSYLKSVESVYQKLIDRLKAIKSSHFSYNNINDLDALIDLIRSEYIESFTQSFKLTYAQEGIELIQCFYDKTKAPEQKRNLCSTILSFYEDNKELAKTGKAEWTFKLNVLQKEKENLDKLLKINRKN